MRIKFLLSSLITFIIISLGYSSNAIEFNKGTIKITQFKLENGLTVILNEDHSKPEVFGVVAVRAGGKNDPADATGLAHYMEHMLFKGTQSLGTIDWEKEKPHIDRIFELYDELAATKDEEERKKIQMLINAESLEASQYAIPNELSNLINSMGGTNLNAGTGPDYTMYYNKFPSSQIFKWIDLYSHRFINPVFRSFQAELEVVYEEKNMYSDQFQSKLLDQFQAVFFKNHPYGQQPLIGTIEHLKNPSLRRMLEFYNNYYVANNMVLVLTGDFHTDEILAFVEEKFGAIPSGNVPITPEFTEKNFQGREFYEARLTPIKLGVIGFRTVTKDHPDYIALEVAFEILNNSSQTGLLDKLTIDGKLLAAQAINLPYNDHGAAIVLLVPKIVGQKLIDAENLILSELKRLAQGDFDEWLIDAIKLNKYTDFQRSLENIENRAMILAGAFTSQQSIDDVLSYTEKVRAITKDDIIRVANTYFGPNFISFHSKMGNPKKEKIVKPGFKPLLANTNAKSVYTNHFETIPVKQTQFTPIDFNADIQRRQVAEGVVLHHVTNPLNDIFTLTIQYNVGNQHIKLLDRATELMVFSGTANKKVDELKREFAKIGCTYSIWSNNSYTTIRIEGIEENLPLAIELINELVAAPVLEQSKLKVMIDGEKANRRMERSEPDNVASALFDYIRYAEKSKSIDRQTMSELKKLKAEQLTSAFQKATKHTASVHYVGKLDVDLVKTLLSTSYNFASNPIEVETPVVTDSKQFAENTVYFVNKKKARQSKIFFFANGEEYTISVDPYLEAFNEYFGGGFSGLVLQEIREYRSLAYGAGGSFSIPPINNKPYNFIGYVATQADKSLIAIETYNGLIRAMPQKPERIGMIKDYLMLSSETRRPGFRNTSSTVEYWKRLGYTSDPIIERKIVYELLTWNDIMNFYSNNLAEKPIAIAIVGDKRMIDFTELSKYGKIIQVKEKNLFSK
jgi:predicted Zn-dependent peptidase